MKCTHDDCFTCPYPDCIYDKAKVKSDKPKRTTDRSEYWAEYYQKNKERIKARRKKHREANKQSYSERAHKYYLKKKGELLTNEIHKH